MGGGGQLAPSHIRRRSESVILPLLGMEASEPVCCFSLRGLRRCHRLPQCEDLFFVRGLGAHGLIVNK
jgi:hypothetical protein